MAAMSTTGMIVATMNEGAVWFDSESMSVAGDVGKVDGVADMLGVGNERRSSLGSIWLEHI